MNKKITRRSILQTSMAASVLSMLPAFSFAQNAVYKPAVPGRPVPTATDYDETTTAEQVTQGLDLSGQVALVTGCNSGLGYETMRVLAMRGAHVIGAARTMEKAENACAGIDGLTTPLAVELTDLPGIVAAADKIAEMDVAIDMLILNAGIMAIPDRQLANGVELQLAVNHLGHFLLTNRLLDQVVAADQGRVVVVSSWAHRWAPEEGIQFNNLDAAEGYDPFQAYGQSKVANGLFSRELARRLAATNATSNSLHPGVIKTNLGRHLPERDDDEESSFRYKSIPEGTATQCYVATNPELAEVTGYYFDNCNPAMPDDNMQNDDLADALWKASEELTAEYLS